MTTAGSREGSPIPWPDGDRSRELLERVLAAVHEPADVRYYREQWTTLRSANSMLYQPHSETVESISLRICSEDGRLGVATSTEISAEGIAALVRRARALAQVAPAVRDFPGFPEDPGTPTPAIPVARGVFQDDLEARGQALADAFAVVEDEIGPARISGVVNQGISQLAVANTSGLHRNSYRTVAQANFLTEIASRDPPPSGWAEMAHWDPARLDLIGLAREAARITPRVRPRMAKPGRYRVLLSGSALFELLSFLSWMGLGALSVEEGWSFLVNGQGKRVAAPEITLVDDPRNPRGLPAALDAEGLPMRRRTLIDRGVARGPAHDTLTAARARTRSTANALPPEAPAGSIGPIPRNLLLRPGTATLEELVKELRRGILVTRFHYVRSVHPGKTTLTGMTRDGTYWVERGEVQHPITNLRFTEGILSTLAGTELVGGKVRAYGDERGFMSAVLPSLVSRSFTFPSATTF